MYLLLKKDAANNAAANKTRTDRADIDTAVTLYN
jgi:hypothetical protein